MPRLGDAPHRRRTILRGLHAAPVHPPVPDRSSRRPVPHLAQRHERGAEASSRPGSGPLLQRGEDEPDGHRALPGHFLRLRPHHPPGPPAGRARFGGFGGNLPLPRGRAGLRHAEPEDRGADGQPARHRDQRRGGGPRMGCDQALRRGRARGLHRSRLLPRRAGSSVGHPPPRTLPGARLLDVRVHRRVALVAGHRTVHPFRVPPPPPPPPPPPAANDGRFPGIDEYETSPAPPSHGWPASILDSGKLPPHPPPRQWPPPGRPHNVPEASRPLRCARGFAGKRDPPGFDSRAGVAGLVRRRARLSRRARRGAGRRGGSAGRWRTAARRPEG